MTIRVAEGPNQSPRLFRLSPQETAFIISGLRPGGSARRNPSNTSLAFRLRHKFARAKLPDIILTIPHKGYVIDRELVQVVTGGVHIFTEAQIIIIRRLIQACPSPTLAEYAREQLFGTY